jgi:hypothetical protein
MTTTAVGARPEPQIIEPRYANSPRIYVYNSSRPGHGPYRVFAFKGRIECPCTGSSGAAKAARAGRVTKSGGECWHKKDVRRREQEREQLLAGQETRMTTGPNADTRAVATVQQGDLAQQSPMAPPPRMVQNYIPQAGELLPTPAIFDMMTKIAATVMKSGAGMVPDNIKTPEAALAVMLAGYELGFPPFAALRQVFIVNGKTALMSEGLLALLKQRDPSLDVEWHESSAAGAEATLWRSGRPVLRMRYDESDKTRAHQGQRRSASDTAGQQWIPIMQPDGRTPKRYPPGHAKAGKIMYERNPGYDPAAEASSWEDDPESSWTRFAPDMYRWAVLKRLERFGAPELVNLAPLKPVEALPGAWTVEEDANVIEAPRSRLSQAIIEGEVSPAAAEAEATVPDLDSDPDTAPAADEEEYEPSDEEIAEMRNEEAARRAVEAGEPFPSVDAVPEEVATAAERVWSEDETRAARQELYNILMRTQPLMLPTQYGDLTRALTAKYCQVAGKLDLNVISGPDALLAVEDVKVASGESDGSSGPPADEARS